MAVVTTRNILNTGIKYSENNIVRQSFICDRCAICCNGTLFGLTSITNEEAEIIADHLNINVTEFYTFYGVGLADLVQPCPFLETEKVTSHCKIYDIRPGACRRFPFTMLEGDTGIDISCPSAKKLVETFLNKGFQPTT